MSYTPVFDQTVAASDPDLWKASPVFPLPACYDILDEYSMDDVSKADIRNAIRSNEPIPVPSSQWMTSTLTVTKPEPTWRTFLRCLFWWLP